MTEQGKAFVEAHKVLIKNKIKKVKTVEDEFKNRTKFKKQNR